MFTGNNFREFCRVLYKSETMKINTCELHICFFRLDVFVEDYDYIRFSYLPLSSVCCFVLNIIVLVYLFMIKNICWTISTW